MADLIFSSEKFPVAVQYWPRGTVPSGTDISGQPDYAKLLWICEGSAVYCCQGKETLLAEGDVLVIYPDCPHFFKACSQLVCYYIYYDPQLPPPLLASCNLPFIHYIFPEKKYVFSDCTTPKVCVAKSDFELVENIILRLRYESRRRRIGHNVLIVACFTELIVYMTRGYSMEVETHSQWLLRKISIYMQDHHSEKLTAAKLARITGMSERNLYRHFHEAYGIGPAEYVIKIRIQHGTELLRDNELSISDIALKCGFSDSNHFCKIFKREFGKTPREYRKEIQSTPF